MSTQVGVFSAASIYIRAPLLVEITMYGEHAAWQLCGTPFQGVEVHGAKDRTVCAMKVSLSIVGDKSVVLLLRY